MSGGHFTLDELRACCRGEDWSLIKPVVEHCRTCELCGDRVAVFLAMNRIRAQRPVVEGIVSPNTAKVVAGVVIAVAVGLLVAGYQWASTDLPPSQDVAELATAQPPPGRDVAGLESNEPLAPENGPGLAAMESAPDEKVVGSEGGQPLASDGGLEPRSTPARDKLVSLATTEPPPAGVVRFLLGSAVLVDTGDEQERLQAAAEMLAGGEYAQASDAFERLQTERPDSRMIAAFLGMSRYLSGEDSERVAALLATGALDQNQTASFFSMWYLANHLLRRGDEERARELLTELVAVDAIPGRLAIELLARLERAPLP
jgi:hypothetical protein